MSLSKKQINQLISKVVINTDDDFMLLVKEGRGWITPKGNCIPCNPYTHIKVFTVFYPELISALEIVQQKNEEARTNWVEGLEEGEHPAWHAFPDNYTWDELEAENNLYAAVYKAGWIRVGSYKHKSQIHVEGTESGLKNQSRTIHDLELATGFRVVKEVKELVD